MRNQYRNWEINIGIEESHINQNYVEENRQKSGVVTPDTDILVLLIGHCTKLPSSTTLRKKGERISIYENYMKLGHKGSEALIGWYAFKGTDKPGSFTGKGVASHFKAFWKLMIRFWGPFPNLHSHTKC